MRAVFIFLMLASGVAWGEELPASPVWIASKSPKEIPYVSLNRLSGGEMELAGPSTILHFWATWCGPCLAELPELEELAGRKGLKVLAISEDRGGAGDVQSYLDRHQTFSHMEVLLDPQRVGARAFAIKTLPTTIILGPDGREFFRLVGAGQWQAPEMLERMGAALPSLP